MSHNDRNRIRRRSHRIDRLWTITRNAVTIPREVLLIIWRAFDFVVLSRQFRPLLLVSVGYFAVFLYLHLRYFLPRNPGGVLESRQIQIVHTIGLIPVYGLGIELARKTVRKEVEFPLVGWKRRILTGIEVWPIFLGIRVLDNVLTSLFGGPLEDVLTTVNAYLLGRTTVTSAWWIELLLETIPPYVLPGFLAVYIARQRLSDLLPVSKYWPILRNETYFALSIAFGLVYFHAPTVVAQAGLDAIVLLISVLENPNLARLFRIVLLPTLLSISYVVPILMSLHVLGETITRVEPIRKSRKQLVDATVQTRLSAYVGGDSERIRPNERPRGEDDRVDSHVE